MKRLAKIVGVVLLVFCVLAFGLWQYMSHADRSRTSDMVADAFSTVAQGAGRLTGERNQYVVTVVNRVGQGRVGVDRETPMAVQVSLSVRGSDRLSDICASMPRVRDAINTTITDRIGPKLRSARVLAPDELAVDGDVLRIALNHLVGGDAIASVQLVLRSAFEARETGCSSDASKTANSAKH